MMDWAPWQSKLEKATTNSGRRSNCGMCIFPVVLLLPILWDGEGAPHVGIYKRRREEEYVEAKQ